MSRFARRLSITTAAACIAMGAAGATVLARAGTTAPSTSLPPQVSTSVPPVGRAAWPVTECGTYSGKGCAPTDQRVDLVRPTFSNPTDITNPLFPIKQLGSAVLLGVADGKPFRSETTLLPRTDTVVWDGQRVEVLLSQYTAYLDGQIDEVALDRYAQADDGSVWYFGEDVFEYDGGTVLVTEGTWLAGRDGPPAMIMPAKPKVGDVFRPENTPGIIFEEVRVKAVDQTVTGPRGTITGAIVTEEIHLDGGVSDKVFAPGYGEFSTASDGNSEAIAVAAPTDALAVPQAEVVELSTSTWGILESARKEDWEAVEATLGRIQRLWKVVSAAAPPPIVADRMTKALGALAKAVKAEQAASVSRAAIEVAQAALDLELRQRPIAAVDIDRFHLHAQQLRVAAAADDLAGMTGQVAVLEWIKDRIGPHLDTTTRQALDAGLRDLRSAADTENLATAADHAARLAATVRSAAAAG